MPALGRGRRVLCGLRQSGLRTGDRIRGDV